MLPFGESSKTDKVSVPRSGGLGNLSEREFEATSGGEVELPPASLGVGSPGRDVVNGLGTENEKGKVGIQEEVILLIEGIGLSSRASADLGVVAKLSGRY